MMAWPLPDEVQHRWPEGLYRRVASHLNGCTSCKLSSGAGESDGAKAGTLRLFSGWRLSVTAVKLHAAQGQFILPNIAPPVGMPTPEVTNA